MSKSKKNTIDPENIIENYGADAVRLFILSDSPPEKDIQWSEQGMVASYKFLQKLWNLNQLVLNKIQLNIQNKENELILEKFVNNTIEKYNYNLSKFNYNVLIASLYETYNFFSEILKKEIGGEVLKANYIKILTIISPIIPHFTSECLEALKIKQNISWPSVDKSKIKTDNVNYVVQLNGKKKGNILTKIDVEEKDLLNQIKNNQKFEKILQDKKFLKCFFVKNRLINILLK